MKTLFVILLSFYSMFANAAGIGKLNNIQQEMLQCTAYFYISAGIKDQAFQTMMKNSSNYTLDALLYSKRDREEAIKNLNTMVTLASGSINVSADALYPLIKPYIDIMRKSKSYKIFNNVYGIPCQIFLREYIQ